jgi:hypothetical protein
VIRVLFLVQLFVSASLAESVPVTIPEQVRSSLIRFSHQAHLNDYGVVCADCHLEAGQSASAADNNLPKEKACTSCHAEEVKDPAQCAKCHLETVDQTGFANPERVIDFHHQYHTEVLGLGCESCHVGMDRTDYAAREHWPVMDDCLVCHQDQDAPFDCATCHPKVEMMRPVSHEQDWMRVHKRHVRTVDMPCSKCHEDSWCEDCHTGALLSATSGPADRVVEMAPASRGMVEQVFQRQHDLGYRFTHPLDAVGKERQCQSCHEPDYCIDCHRVEGQEERYKPVWHGPVPGEVVPWILGNVGSGGGRHGQWARRDMERCVACHDVEGDDPSCVQCHIDPDGVRGTDPQTHPARYAEQIGEGDFHESPASLCYTCHVDTNISGVGFCGYCHQ